MVVAFLITFPRSQIDIAKNYLQIFSLSVVPLYVKEVLAYFSLGIKYGFIELSFGDWLCSSTTHIQSYQGHFLMNSESLTLWKNVVG